MAPPNIETPRRNGAFPPGISGNPRGRPRGSTNRFSRRATALLTRQLLEDSAAELTQKLISEALAGNILAIKLCADRLLPASQDAPIPFDLPAPGSPSEEILAAHDALLKSIASGEVTPREAESISNVIEARRRSWEAVHLSDELTHIEDRLDHRRKPKIEFKGPSARNEKG